MDKNSQLSNVIGGVLCIGDCPKVSGKLEDLLCKWRNRYAAEGCREKKRPHRIRKLSCQLDVGLQLQKTRRCDLGNLAEEHDEDLIVDVVTSIEHKLSKVNPNAVHFAQA